MPRALISVSDKTGLVDLARGLAARGYDLVSTGGTAQAITAAGLTPLSVSEVTGFPELMDGRLKTLHPLVHGGILARRSRPDHLESAARHGIGLIDLVVVNLYPFVGAAANPLTPFGDLIEEIDIGGPAMLRAAAKNFHDVLVVVAPADYEALLAEIDRDGGPTPAFRLDLARKAFAHTSAYDAAIAATLAAATSGPSGYARGSAGVHPPVLSVSLRKVQDLRYGENPHQTAAWYAEGASGFGAAQMLQGRELSYTNLLDLDAAVRIVREFSEPAAAVIKHANPCGVATGADAADAYVRARDADALSAFGGIVALNRPIDAAAARALIATKIDAVVAPSVAAEALPVLSSKDQMRVVVIPLEASEEGVRELRSIAGAMLAQSADRVTEAAARWPDGTVRVVSRRQPTEAEWQALRFAWRVCAHVKSNAVIFTSSDRTLAIGAGQMSRVDAVNVARLKAEGAARGPGGSGESLLKGGVAASDAFFPFRDGLDAVASAGATAVVQPGGSLRDAEVIAAADEHGLAMVFTGRRHFRH
jgi:phosphoribosylaminoimidazolecarboxamide formyltransferase/IMP cyclohydrolase